MEWEIVDINEDKDEKGYIIQEKIERTRIVDGWLVKFTIYSRSRQTMTGSGRGVAIGVGIGAGSGITYIPDSDRLWLIDKKRKFK
jgi:hypothetical protein